MVVVQDDIWLCVDCLVVACNGDSSGCESNERASEVARAVAEMGPHLVPDFDSETEEGIEDFSGRMCDCCFSDLAGSRHRFAILAEKQLWLPSVDL